MYHKIKIIFGVFAVAIFLHTQNIYSYPNGVSGFTQKSGNSGCGSCHNTHESANSLVKVEFSGPKTLKTGETGNYTVVISGGSGEKVGVNIASSNGELANIDNNLKVKSSELTQTSSKKYSNEKYTFNFKYTAPQTAGSQTLYATGLSSKRQWNFAPNYNIQIEDITTDVSGKSNKPETYSLSQNFPNPFNPTSKINFSLPKESDVKLLIFNSLGETVKELVNGIKPKGFYEINFNASSLPSGTYFYSLEATSLDGEENFKLVKKMSLIK